MQFVLFNSTYYCFTCDVKRQMAAPRTLSPSLHYLQATELCHIPVHMAGILHLACGEKRKQKSTETI